MLAPGQTAPFDEGGATAQLRERAPAFFEWAGGSMIYVGEDDISLGSTSLLPGIAAGYSPATGMPPPPLPFPATP